MSAEVITAVRGVVSTIVGSIFSFSKGKQKRQIENQNEIIKQYQTALDDLRNEFEERIQRLQKEIDELRKMFILLEVVKGGNNNGRNRKI